VNTEKTMTNGGRTFEVALAGRGPKPILDAQGATTGWRCHGYDEHKRVFLATLAQGSVLKPLMDAGGGQTVRIRYGACSTLGVLVDAVDPDVQALIAAAEEAVPAAPVQTATIETESIVWAKGTPIADRARILFDATPSGHPSGRLPEWGMQPESIRTIFERLASRLPYDGFGDGVDRDDVPQTALREVAVALWRRARSPRALETANCLWLAAAILDLDYEGARVLDAEVTRHSVAIGSTDAANDVLHDHEIEMVGAVIARLRDILSMAGSGPAAVPFRSALGITTAALDLAAQGWATRIDA
jgi:hypothetical protein